MEHLNSDSLNEGEGSVCTKEFVSAGIILLDDVH